MKLFKENTKISWSKWVGVVMLTTFTGLYSCDSSQTRQDDTNLGEQQTGFEVDTTGTASRGGTDHSMGRANADTSGTGRQMTNDTVNKK